MTAPRPVAALVVVLAVALGGCLGPGDGSVPTPPEGRGPVVEPRLALERIADGLESPLLVTHAGDGSGRLFIVEQPGRVRVWRDGGIVREPFLNIVDRVGSGGERGLLGIAFDPRFASNGRVLVSYTDASGASVLSRFTSPDGERLDPGSEEVLLRVDQPFGNHNGGHVAFGPDGRLYYGLGDGGSAGDPRGNGQDPSTLLGAVLRLDVSGEAGYSVPDDNPFAGGEGGAPEVWAFGLRNPWRFGFDRATGDLWIADVGQNSVEEVNYQPAASEGGENYGWNVWEGERRYRPGDASSEVTFPVAQYARAEGDCSVTGGYVYRGSEVPDLVGAYVFGDYCSGRVRTVTSENGEWVMRLVEEASLRISSFGEDEAGEVYVVDHGGSVHRVVAD